jgi:MOSC domain-containing protein YiiM
VYAYARESLDAWQVGEPGWLKQFTEADRSGTYLRVLTGGFVRAGDPVQIVHRPAHDVTVALVFRAILTDRSLLRRLLAADEDLPEDLRDMARSGRTFELDP